MTPFVDINPMYDCTAFNPLDRLVDVNPIFVSPVLGSLVPMQLCVQNKVALNFLQRKLIEIFFCEAVM